MDADNEIKALQEKIDQLEEELFNCQTNSKLLKNQNIALKEFLGNLLDSCRSLKDCDLGSSKIFENLTFNIHAFLKGNNIRV